MDDQTEKLKQAVVLHRDGNLDAAESVYLDVLSVDPNNHNALHLSGVVSLQKKDPLKAVEAISRAVKIYETSAAYFCNLGAAFHQLEQFDHAITNFSKALELNPNYIEAQFNLSNVYRDCGNLVEAIEALESIIQIDPDHAEANTSLRLIAIEQEEDSLASLQKLLTEQPKNINLIHKVSVMLFEEGCYEESLINYGRVLEIDHKDTTAIHNTGLCYLELSDYENAMQTFRSLLQIQPSHREARCNLGIAFKQAGLFEEAINCFQELVSKDPADYETWSNLGNAYKDVRQYDQAENCYRKSVKQNPKFAVGHGNLGNLLQMTGDAEAALKHLQTANELDANWHRKIAQAFVIPPIYRSLDDLKHWRSRLEKEISTLVEEGVTFDPSANLVPAFFYSAFHGQNDRELAVKIARLAHSEYRPEHVPRQPRTDSRIHVGFYSSYFYTHTIGHLMRGLIAELDREMFHVTVFSPNNQKDAIGKFILNAADEYVVISRAISKACEEIAARNLDVLFFSDIGMEPVSACLAHHRLAPVQCVTWGHPVTTGIPTIDYFLSSELLELPEADNHYTEKLVRLKALPTYYYAPTQNYEAGNRLHFGFEKTDHLYICPQSLFKIHPEFDEILAEILKRDSKGKLVFIEGLHKQWSEILKRRFEKTLGTHSAQVCFLPRQSYQNFLRLIASADVILDPIHFGGGNTNYESFSLGIPVVTLPSHLMRTRVASALYGKMGVEGCVTENAEEFIAKAIQIVNDNNYAIFFREEIRNHSHKIFEDKLAIEELEKILVQVIEQTKTKNEQRNAS